MLTKHNVYSAKVLFIFHSTKYFKDFLDFFYFFLLFEENRLCRHSDSFFARKQKKYLEISKKMPIFASRELGHCQRSPVNPVEAPSSCQVIAKGSR